MDQSPTLQKLLLNIIYEVTAPNKTDKLDAYQMIGLLALTNLLGIINMLNQHSHHREYLPFAANSSGAEGDLLNSLMSALSNKKGGANLPDINPQTLMTILGLLSSLGSKGRTETGDSQESVRESSV
ncbi:MAG: hypothetical protein GX052_03615 [Syntrophomonadaceae bacterium]|jgi:hypothetical protein|nr:hypothetical protein [Syntrophomonadaceae bacterium]